MTFLSPWVSTSAGLVLYPASAQWCVLRGSGFIEFLYDMLVPVIVAFHFCPWLPSVCLWVSWLVPLSVCVWRFV
jgi:hypothetical protein